MRVLPSLMLLGAISAGCTLSAQSSCFSKALPAFTGETHPLHVPAQSTALGDVDGNGLQDFVLFGPKVHIVYQYGDRRFRRVSLDIDLTAGLVSDVDGDGDLDLIVSGNSKARGINVELWRNDGAGGFGASPASILIPRSVFQHSLRGDVDGDGDEDLFLRAGTRVQLLINDGKGGFRDETAFRLARQASFAFALLDVDGDSDLDFVHMADSAGRNRIWLNDGRGVFATDASLAFPQQKDTAFFQFVDVDADGDLDFVSRGAGSSIGGKLRLNLNNGNLAFGPSSLLYSSTTMVSFACADFDGDKRIDIAVGERLAPVTMLIGDGKGGFRQKAGVVPTSVEGARELFATDYDADGDQDLFVTNAELFTFRSTARSLRCKLWTNDGVGKVVDLPLRERQDYLPFDKDFARAALLFDADRDGDLDVIVARNAARRDRFFANDGDGSFTEKSSGVLPDLTDDTSALAFVDTDRDGRRELVSVNWAAPHVRVASWRNGAFVSTWVSPGSLRRQANALAVGDLNGDRIDDLVIGNFSLPNSVYFGDGRGGFVEGASFSTRTRTLDVCVLDVDRDGDLDVLEAHDQLSLFLNDGRGRFTDASRSLPFAGLVGRVGAIGVGDLDGDGDGDVIVGTYGGVTYDLAFENVGKLSYRVHFLRKTAAMARDRARGVTLADLDEDGDLDVIIAAEREEFSPFGGGGNRLVRNDGQFRFTVLDLDASRGETTVSRIAVGDLDGDGDLDCFVPNHALPRASIGQQNSLHFNLLRHVEVEDHVRVGKTLDLAIYSYQRSKLSGLLAIPMIAAGRAQIPIPGFGTLRLDLATLALLPALQTAGAGRAAFKLPVPNNPALIGADVYVQAIVEGRDAAKRATLRFTDVVRETILR